ncbi:universal stress protein [Methylocapsa aurea]|uniref:universal stress protein n=1 Tax=Methylocapsa aurea TaxID=663610 RepID=UPI000565E878|nr:universal stress protein [Methylocapsa aurea]
MSYATLMVYLDLDHSNDARLNIAGALAERFEASVIGVAACLQTMPLYFTDGFVADSLIDQDRAEIEKRLCATEERFRASLAGRAKRIEWRCAMTPPTAYVAEQCRAADLVIIGANRDGVRLDPLRQLVPSDLVTVAGRPILVIPQEVEVLAANRVIIGWKDAPEARRAVFDALPLLQRCEKAIVAEIDENDDPNVARAHVDDVVAWLRHHGVNASGTVRPMIARASEELDAVARQEEADLIVVGAFGHSRLREWVLGGVTRDLILRTPRCTLFAH